MRKLLPYEHQLVEALGISEEEYLEFVAVQQEYKDAKIGTALDVRNGAGTVAIVLTVVGILFQVGAALLAPKPEIPDIKDRQRRNREQRFAPTFGFNSTQELASYGDPVNLVYTNQNDKGNVRVAGSLVWSAIENFGSTQFMQLLLVLGASKIQSIDYSKTAFGQAGLIDLDKQSVFLFAKTDGSEGRPNFGDIQDGFGTKSFYPLRLKSVDSKPAFQIVTHNEKKLGFSQAYTPSTSTSLGVFDAIPINVDVFSRNGDGGENESRIGIELRDVTGTANYKWRNGRGRFVTGDNPDKIQLFFNNAGYVQEDKEPAKSADDMRRQMVEALDFGSTYMLGSAKFRLDQVVSSATNIDEGEVKVNFICIEPGQIPSSPYDRVEPKTENKSLKANLENAQAILSDARTIEGVEGARTENIVVTSTSPRVDIRFTGNKTVEWTPTFNAEIELANGKTQTVRYVVDTKGRYVFPSGGSIAYTREQKDQLMASKPKIKTKKIRKDIRRQKKALKALIEDIYAGTFNGGDELPWGNNSYGPPYSSHFGRDPNERFVNEYINSISGRDLIRVTKGKYKLHDYGNKIIGQSNTVPNNSTPILFNIIYIDRNGIWNFFQFNGIDKANGEKFFPNDEKLQNKRDKLKNAKENLKKLEKQDSDLDQDTTTITAAARDPASPSLKKEILNKGTTLDLLDFNSSVGDLEDTIENRRQNVKDRIDRNFEKRHKIAVEIIQDDIDYLDALQDALPVGEDFITDQDGTNAVKNEIRSVIKDKEKALKDINEILEDWDAYRQSLDNNFFSKCLVKAESTSYETLSLCDSVKFSFKARLFRRISGRQKKYADRKVKEYSASDNGVKSRMAFFRMFYKSVQTKKGGLTINGVSGWSIVPYVFAVRRGSDADFYTQLGFYNSTKDKWQFRFEPVFDMQAEYLRRGFTRYAFLENTDRVKTVSVGTSVFFWYGKIVGVNTLAGYYPDEDERGPVRTNEWDMFSVNSDTQVQFSFESGPEITLTAVTEQQSDSSYGNKYSGMTMMGLGVFAGRGIQDLRSISTLVTKGKLCRTVENPNVATESSSYAPDIFVDTVLDNENGIGKYVDVISIDKTSLKQAKDFCKNNNLPLHVESGKISLFMDGLIADVGSWREFWINVAPFSLLELARKNGKDTLVPALPTNSSGRAADNNGLPIGFNVSALFTAGNILEGSYKEEHLNYGSATEDIIASVIYRKYNEDEIFSGKESVDISLRRPSGTAIRETFDLSQFVTQREQAIMFGKLLCNQRRYIRKGIEFQTFPSEAVIAPGDFIYVDVGMEHWDSYSAGVIMDGGSLNSPLLDARPNGTYQFLLYKGQTGETKSFSSVSVSNGVAFGLSGYKGWMFVMGTQKPQKRVYRVTELAIEEEGEVSVKALEYPCFESGGQLRARIADFRKDNFDVS